MSKIYTKKDAKFRMKVNWEGTKQFNYQTIYAVYALPAGSVPTVRTLTKTATNQNRPFQGGQEGREWRR